MITQVLRNYLTGIERERHFDTPLGLLLPTLDFYDVHYTHGTIEFGKDFIAKRIDGGVEIQCSFQLKRGNISLSDWRNEIQHQMLQSVLTPLRHPNFDRGLTHQAYLVTTGEISTPAAMAIDELNTQIQDFYKRSPIKVWSQSNLIDNFIDSGLNSLYSATAEGFAEYGAFFQLYSGTLRGDVTINSIETYSRHWVRQLAGFEKWALWCSLECESIAQQCMRTGQVYEAVYVYLCRLRAVCAACYSYPGEQLSDSFQFSLPRIVELCSLYVNTFRGLWEPQCDLLASDVSPTDFISYPVQCSRVMEIASLLYFLDTDVDQKAQTIALLEKLVIQEPGCGHPISDRHAISLAVASLALLDASRDDAVRRLLERATVWIGDRYEKALGLATVDSDETEEVETLLGSDFDFTKTTRRQTSLVGTVVKDLSAFMEDAKLYDDIANDLEACDIAGEYYQARDTLGACLIDGEDVLMYPTVEYAESLGKWDSLDCATHLREELRDFAFTRQLGPGAAIVLAVVLRDRYYPGIWNQLVDPST